MASRLLTIVFTDIKGFTERTSQADRSFVLKLRERHDALLKPIIRQYGGYLVKTIGDAFLLTFESPTNAVLCALMMQDCLRKYNLTAPANEKIEIRVAINTGEVTVTDGDILGDPVNVASRVEHITEANEVWFTEATYLAMNKQEVPNSLVGEFRLKGVPEALKVYRVVQDIDSEKFKEVLATQQAKMADGGDSGRPALGLPFILLILAILLGTLFAVVQTWRSAVDPLLLEARHSLETGQALPALLATSRILRQSPNDPEALNIMRSSLDKAVREAIQRKEVATAAQLLNDHRKQFSFLGPLPDLEALVTTWQARELVWKGEKDKADAMVIRLAEGQKGHEETLRQVAQFYDDTGCWWYKTILAYHTLAMTDPVRFASDPKVIEQLDYFLKQAGPEDGMDEIRTYIASYCFERYKTELFSSLGTRDEENRTRRWNAFLILPRGGIAVDARAHYLKEILDSPGYLNSDPLNEAMDFFLNGPGNASPPELVDRFPLFARDLLATDSKVMHLAGGPFFKPMETWLYHALGHPASLTERMNAFSLLQEKKALQPDQIWCFQAAQVLDWENVLNLGSTYRNALPDALQYLAAHPTPPVASGSTLVPQADPGALKAALAQIIPLATRNLAAARDRGYEGGVTYWTAVEAGSQALEKILLGN